MNITDNGGNFIIIIETGKIDCYALYLPPLLLRLSFTSFIHIDFFAQLNSSTTNSPAKCIERQ